jgi:hypothetical protein
VRPFAILVPWDEVLEREGEETGDVVWTAPPPEGGCVHFDVVYIPQGMPVTGHPGARSMGTGLVGKVELADGQRVDVTSRAAPMGAELRANVDRLKNMRILDADGNPIEKTGALAFGIEPNPDAADGTEIGTFVDVTRPDE